MDNTADNRLFALVVENVRHGFDSELAVGFVF